VRLDPHVHTHHSGYTTLRPLTRLLRESYNSPDSVYRTAKARGMDLVTITDHDQISGALSIAHLPDVIVGCEVTAVFPGESVNVHLGVLDITEAQHGEIQRLRGNIRELLPYLRREQIFTTINHIASRENGDIQAHHIAAVTPWVDAVEVRNGTRLASQNRTAVAVAEGFGKIPIGASDSHTGRGIGRTWVEVPGATDRASFMAGLRAGRVRVGGQHGSYLTMASDIVRFASNFYRERGRLSLERPLDWRTQTVLTCAVVGAPLVAVPLVLAAGHFVLESRFNRSLLFDLVAQPARRVPELA
jgi:predicted metal-dependent phosphoesterase TrpH